MPVGDALFVGDAETEALWLGEEVAEDWVGIGLAGSSSEQPTSASDIKDSTVSVLAVRDLPMGTSCSGRYPGGRTRPGRLAHPTRHDPSRQYGEEIDVGTTGRALSPAATSRVGDAPGVESS